MSRARYALLSAALACGWAGSAAAAEAAEPPLRLHVQECAAAGVPAARLVEILSTELAPRSIELVDDATTEPSRCEVILCYTLPDAALLRLFRGGVEIAERQLDLSDVQGESRIRTLAAILAETLSAHEQQPVASAKTEPFRVVGELAPPPVGSVHLVSGTIQRTDALNTGVSRAWHSGATLLVREYSRAGAPFLGTEVHLGYRRFVAELAMGRAHVTTLTGDITQSFVVMATTLEVTRFFRGPELIPRLRFETGATWAESHASEAATVATTHAGVTSAAMLELGLYQHIVARTSMVLKVLAGYSGGFTATENGVARSSTSGWTVSFGLGANFDL